MRASHLLVLAGGTGGHVFPALSVALALRDRGVNITWLGTKRGLESSVVPANNIHMEWVTVEGLRGKSSLSLVLAPFKLLRAVIQSVAVIRRIKPDCVLGMGGFVSGPGGLAAIFMRKPLIIHEQNAVAGLTNKWLAKMANRILCGFPNVVDLPPSATWVGNPVRNNISEKAIGEDTANGSSLNVLVVGGSQGAYSFNLYLPELFSNLDLPVNILHQTGKGNLEEVEAAYLALEALDGNQPYERRCQEFIDDMASAYAWADVVVCRAGAMTIAELCAAAKPALLVPYPFSAGDHQDFNAQFLVERGAAVSLKNQDLQSGLALTTLNALLADRSNLKKMGRAAASIHKADALETVVGVCQEYLDA